MKRRTLLGAISASMLGMAGCLGRDEYTLSKPDVEQTDDPLRIDASLSDRNVTIDGSPTLTLTLENTGSKPLQIRARKPLPFGVPVLNRSNDQFGRVILLSDQYEKIDSVNVTVGSGFQSVSVGGRQSTQVLAPGDPITKKYTVRGNMIGGAGTYELQRYGQGRATSAPRTQQANSSNGSNRTDGRRSRPDDWRYLFQYRPKGGKKYYAYQPTVSITVSTKGLLPDL